MRTGTLAEGIEVDLTVDLLHEKVDGVLRRLKREIDLRVGDLLIKRLDACFDLRDQLTVLRVNGLHALFTEKHSLRAVLRKLILKIL